MSDPEVARMIVEGLAYQLGALPESVWDHASQGGCSQVLVEGLRLARDAYCGHVTENDVVMLADQIEHDIRHGLAELNKARP